jgi:hypothetical protein
VEGVIDEVGVSLGVGVGVAETEGVGDGVCEGEGEGVLEEVGVTELVGDGVGAVATLKLAEVPVYADPPGSCTEISNA